VRSARRHVAGTLDRLGLLSPLIRGRERWISGRAGDGPAVDPDGIPMPPARLRVLVDGHGDPYGFIADSEAAATMIGQTLSQAGVAPGDLRSVLDFGCGCGRVIRHWARMGVRDLHGCDYNPELVAWCRDNLPFMTARVNSPSPPSPYADDQFDLVYAVSIVTHMTEAAARAWIADLARILKPGGLLLVTTHGGAHRQRLTSVERRRFDAGELVVQRPGVAGTNACAVYHPRRYVTERLLDRFELVSHPGDRRPRAPFPQDVYLARLRTQIAPDPVREQV
jgi:SAM-dependent methyltransferase